MMYAIEMMLYKARPIRRDECCWGWYLVYMMWWHWTVGGPEQSRRCWLSHFFVSPHPQGGDSDDDGDAFTGSEDTQASIPPPSQDLEGVSTYGEGDLVPEPHRVSEPAVQCCRLESMCLSVCFSLTPFFRNFSKSFQKVTPLALI